MLTRRSVFQAIALGAVPVAAVTVAASSFIKPKMPVVPEAVRAGDLMRVEDWNSLVNAVRDLQQRV